MKRCHEACLRAEQSGCFTCSWWLAGGIFFLLLIALCFSLAYRYRMPTPSADGCHGNGNHSVQCLGTCGCAWCNVSGRCLGIEEVGQGCVTGPGTCDEYTVADTRVRVIGYVMLTLFLYVVVTTSTLRFIRELGRDRRLRHHHGHRPRVLSGL